MNLRAYPSVAARRKALEKTLGVTLGNVGSFTLDETVAGTRNCENMIGVAQVPMGIAGPVRLTHSFGDTKEYYLPLATTEGALVASVNRGCKAITLSGGATVDSHAVGATRGPVFKVASLGEQRTLYEFFKRRFDDLKKVAEATSQHLTLKKISSRGVGKYRYARFVFDTKDAMGLNMVTIASDAIVSYIKQQTGISCIALAGNYDVDKKPAWLNIVDNRGTKAWAEVTIPSSVLRDVLKTTAKKVHEVWLAKCMLGSAMSGAMAFNAQFANIVAALFLACGQDIAHVGEGSLGITTTEIIHNDLYVSVYLPDLMVGSVGGGTALATQHEALSLLGVAGGKDGKNAQTFAQIIAGAVLAGEISLLSSLEQGSLARAHQVLGRGKK